MYAPDLRGHGRSGRVARAYNLTDYVGDTAAFLEQVVSEPPVVFGHSLGGEIAVMTAARRPELIRALIVGDAPLSTRRHPTEKPDHRAMNVFLRDLAGKPPAEIEPKLRDMPLGPEQKRAREILGEDHQWYAIHAKTMSMLNPDMLTAVLDGPEVMLAGYDPQLLLPKINCPVLLLQADPDGPMQGGMLRDEDADLLVSLPNCAHVRLPNVGHLIHQTQTETAVRLMTAFLESLREDD